MINMNVAKEKNKRTYDGNTIKFGVNDRDNRYIIKLSKKKNDSSVYSEYVSSEFMGLLGYNAHKTWLVKDKKLGTIVVLEDFVNKGEYLRSHRAIEERDETKEFIEYTYQNILESVVRNNKLSYIHKREVMEQFWDMYMLDAILGNRDRHHGNWGYVCKGREYRAAKIYDNGASLFPSVLGKLGEYDKDRKIFLYERCEKFPASLILEYDKKEDRYKRTNYYECIGKSARYKEMETSYQKIKSIELKKVYESIKEASNHELIPELLRKFYIDIVCIRYMHIMERLDFEECYRSLLNVCK